MQRKREDNNQGIHQNESITKIHAVIVLVDYYCMFVPGRLGNNLTTGGLNS